MRKHLLSNRVAVCFYCSFVAKSFTCAICKIDSFNLSPFFNLIQPGDLAKDVEWSSDNKRDLWFPSLRLWYPCLFVWAAVFFSILGIIFGFDFGPNFGYHFCPYFWGVLQKKGIDGLWKREQKLYPKLGSKFNLKNLIQKRETNQCRHQRRRDRSCLLSLDHCKSLAKSPGVGSNFKNDRLKKERMEHIANERVQSSNKGAF